MSMIGKSLIHYEISAELGRGGMGEVYQAKDTKLGRDVAIKVLPEEFALDKDRVARFQREAKLLASLNHPNIAAIYGLEESEGTHFLVMELIEGETLRDRIKSGPIPVEEALKLALQMAEALEAAHEKGVIHRDLKPANIKVTPDGKVKILDFGLAKAYVGDQENINLADSPTISAAATQQGVILGTAAYMSPEQAKGKSVDKRADIWAFGIVLFEMLTGRQSFTGETASETLASVMKSEPEWDNLPPNLHSRIRFLLERCLEKQPKDRYSGISDARVEIQKVLADPSGVFVQPSLITKPKKKLRVGISWVAAALVLGLVIAGVAIWHLKPSTPLEQKRVMRSYYELPEDQQLYRAFDGGFHVAVSPDGSQFAYSTTKGIYIRSMSELDARLISGTDEDASSLFFSPDGQWIGYFSLGDRKIKSISVSGGAPTGLCDAAFVIEAYWDDDNTIVYSDLTSGICRIPDKGGTPEVLVERQMVAAGGLLPDGKSVMFVDFSNQPPKTMVQSLDTGDQKVVFESGGGSYLQTGHLIYGAEGNIFAVPFDLEKLELTGGAVSLMETPIGMGISASGTLVYVPLMADAGGSTVSPKRTLVWVDLEGNEETISAPPDFYQFPDISPDGTKVALTVTRDGNRDIWIWDLIRENLSRLTFDEARDVAPLWTPDGKRIVFMSFRDGNASIFWKAADGTGKVEKLGSVPAQNLYPWSWSSDGKTLVTVEIDLTFTDANIGSMSIEGNGERNLLVQTDHVESHPRISPDGRWMAYFSDETGDWHLFVRPYPEVDQGKWQVSIDGGQSPLWSPDGRELYYLYEDAIMAAEVNTEPTFSASKPKTLFRGNYITGYQENPEWDISPDGKLFLMIKSTAATDGESSEESTVEIPRKIIIVQNWFEELKQRVPVN
jgi:serine/threonine protein kinase/Tol biopolymer transport system component